MVTLMKSSMESVRADICYRPLRIGWAIRAGDMDAFRAATRLSFALWGGRFNPIIIVDHRDEAESLIDVFRVDVILPIGDSEDVKGFVKRFPYLIKPFHSESVFMGDGEGGARSQVLDIHNALVHLHRKPEWKTVKEQGVRLFTWAPDDPLADIFLMQFGDYPNPDEILIHYRDLLREASEATEVKIDPTAKLPADIFEHPSIAFMSRCGLQRHYGVRAGWDTPGFFSGDYQNLDDLVCCWNLRAADIPVLFVDPKHLDRYELAIESWDKTMREMVSHRRHEFEQRLAVWVREESLNGHTPEALTEALKPFGARASAVCTVGEGSWNGLNIRPPTMHFGRVSTLGGHEYGIWKTQGFVCAQ